MLQNYVMNASLYSRWLRFTKQEQTLYIRRSQTMENIWYVNCDFWEGQILKMTLPQKNGHRIKTPSSKLTILVSSCWENNFIRNNVHNFLILYLVFLKLLIVSVAFFLGHPVYIHFTEAWKREKETVSMLTFFPTLSPLDFWVLKLNRGPKNKNKGTY